MYRGHRSSIKPRRKILMNPHLNISSVQFEPDNNFSPESCRLLFRRSTSLKQHDWELRTDDRISQVLPESLHDPSLRGKPVKRTDM